MVRQSSLPDAHDVALFVVFFVFMLLGLLFVAAFYSSDATSGCYFVVDGSGHIASNPCP